MLDDAGFADYAKTKRYAYIDLSSKVLSALALVALRSSGLDVAGSY